MNHQIKTNRQAVVYTAIAAMVLMFSVNPVAFAQTGYQVGDRIEAEDGNKWYKAQIVDAKDGKFKIHYDGYDAVMDVWRFPGDLRRIGEVAPTTPSTSAANAGSQTQTQQQAAPKSNTMQYKPAAPAQPAEGAAASTKPKLSTPAPTNGVLTGTAWSLRLYYKSKGYSADGTVMTMIFCPSGTWDIVRYGLTPGTAGAVGQRGTYTASGRGVTLKNGQDGKSDAYTVTWLDGRTVELSDGSDLIWRLFDGMKTTCK